MDVRTEELDSLYKIIDFQDKLPALKIWTLHIPLIWNVRIFMSAENIFSLNGLTSSRFLKRQLRKLEWNRHFQIVIPLKSISAYLAGGNYNWKWNPNYRSNA